MIFQAPVIHPPKVLRRLFPDAWWSIGQAENAVYLTFDDGPVPEATPWVLDLLEKENIKATFFCVGENVSKYPELYRRIIDAGHSTGNHTFNHLQGIKCDNQFYYDNIAKASRLIDSNLFRPPHGLMKPEQYRHLKRTYRVVMWDILSMDHHSAFTPEMTIRTIERFVKQGSVITFHDSVKTLEKLRIILPAVIKMLKDNGFQPLPISFIPISRLHLHPEPESSLVASAS
jgi:peptidoglycan-N-acetylglucosamine deacetylase